jgi:hypothetical protein
MEQNRWPTNRWREKDYLRDYSPMLGLITNVRDDYDFLASEPGYHPDLARNFRDRWRKGLRTYLIALIADFEDLYAGATRFAVMNPEIARELVQVKTALTRTIGYIRFRLMFEGIVPPPKTHCWADLIRRLLVKLTPESDETRRLLIAMNQLRDSILSLPEIR